MVRAIELHELLGATLAAVVKADAEAAKATLEFVRTVGFIPPDAETDGDDVEAGQLRMAEFRYQKLDENNEVSEFVAAVPVLSLVSIPGLQVKEAKFSLSAKFADIVPAPSPASQAARSQETQPTEQLAATAQSRATQVIQPVPYKLMAQPVAASKSKTDEIKGSFHMDLEVTVQQADIPLGLEKVLELMDQSIRDRKGEGDT